MLTRFFLKRPRFAQIIVLVIFILRFRAVLMTGLSFIFGVMPLLFTSGASAVARQSLGMPVFWGMLSVVIFSTLMTPAFYPLLQKIISTGSIRQK